MHRAWRTAPVEELVSYGQTYDRVIIVVFRVALETDLIQVVVVAETEPPGGIQYDIAHHI